MPVTIKTASHGSNNLPSPPAPQFTTAKGLLMCSCNGEYQKMANDNLIQSSFNIGSDPGNVPSDNGFIDAAMRAYDQHHHLRIRPEEVWFSILVQLNVYINEHAEDLRKHFVQHEGKKMLILSRDEFQGSEGDDWGKFAYLMTNKLRENLNDPTLKDWILPAFTTTTKRDQEVASIIMMSTLQKYFSYAAEEICGIPSVTLLGEKADWEKILMRVGRLPEFGKEPIEWCGLLRPVLTRLVRSFDEPDSESTIDFWQKMVHHDASCCGRSWTSGWINAFCFWDGLGKSFRSHSPEDLILDGVSYHRIDLPLYPSAHVSVPVTMIGFGVQKALMVAGVVYVRASSSGAPQEIGSTQTLPDARSRDEKASFWGKMKRFSKGVHRAPASGPLIAGKTSGSSSEVTDIDKKEKALDTLQPESGWWIFESKSDKELQVMSQQPLGRYRI